MVAGAGLLAWSAGIHLRLWAEGYRSLPTIGWLFLLQAVAGFGLAALVLFTRRTVPALAGSVFLTSTIGGLVWSVEWGLFGFRDSYHAPFATQSLGIEAAGAATLAFACLLRHHVVRRRRPAAPPAPRVSARLGGPSGPARDPHGPPA